MKLNFFGYETRDLKFYDVCTMKGIASVAELIHSMQKSEIYKQFSALSTDEEFSQFFNKNESSREFLGAIEEAKEFYRSLTKTMAHEDETNDVSEVYWDVFGVLTGEPNTLDISEVDIDIFSQVLDPVKPMKAFCKMEAHENKELKKLYLFCFDHEGKKYRLNPPKSISFWKEFLATEDGLKFLKREFPYGFDNKE